MCMWQIKFDLIWFMQAHPDMTLQHDNATSHTARSVCDILQDRNVSVLPRPAKTWISIPLSTSGTCSIGSWGLGPFPPEMSGNLQVPWKSWVTSHCKNWQIWCSPWGGDALQYLMQLVATPDTDCYFWFWPPICSGKHYYISVSHMTVELVQCMSKCLNLVMFIQIFTHVKFVENKRSWQWKDVSFFCWVNIYLLLDSHFSGGAAAHPARLLPAAMPSCSFSLRLTQLVRH